VQKTPAKIKPAKIDATKFSVALPAFSPDAGLLIVGFLAIIYYFNTNLRVFCRYSFFILTQSFFVNNL